mmetsp:Transcript_15098/g.16636  ORF Transcript_15098/g.16636 Transcript_15098/m.16636 type:complete len:89 (+) Transcript_15098:156-422(+)
MVEIYEPSRRRGGTANKPKSNNARGNNKNSSNTRRRRKKNQKDLALPQQPNILLPQLPCFDPMALANAMCVRRELEAMDNYSFSTSSK